MYAFKYNGDGYFKFYETKEEVENEDPFLQIREEIMDQVVEHVYGIKVAKEKERL